MKNFGSCAQHILSQNWQMANLNLNRQIKLKSLILIPFCLINEESLQEKSIKNSQNN